MAGPGGHACRERGTAMLERVRRRSFLRGTAGTLAAAAMAPAARPPRTAGAQAAGARAAGARAAGARAAREKFRELDSKIMAGMKRYGIPGTAVAVRYQGHVHVRGFGVTNSRYPVPVGPDTLFQIGSITKTCTGVALLRLAGQGRVDLDAEVRRYLPGLRLPPGTFTVTVRDLVTHAAGWLPQVFTDYGRGADALPRYVAALHRLPVLTPPGTLYNYGASQFSLAGYLVQRLTGTTYEYAVQDLLLRPLGLRHSFFFADEIFGYNVCAPHKPVDGRSVPVPPSWYLPRSVTPAGATLVSSVTDLLRYGTFALGDGRAPDGARLLSPQAMRRLRAPAGPGGTDQVEFLGATEAGWHVRPTAQGPHIVYTGGDTNAMKSVLVIVPAQDFAIAWLANSAAAGFLELELFTQGWAVHLFTGLTSLPARERRLSRAELAPYEGRYAMREIPQGAGTTVTTTRKTVTAEDGGLRLTPGSLSPAPELLTFYDSPFGRDYVVDRDGRGKPTGYRFNFVRDAAGRVRWLYINGGLFRHESQHTAYPRPWPASANASSGAAV
jgi:CubicO group peptidase (beta-lactamase class C family)